VRLTRQAAGIGRPRLRVAISPGMPEALSAATVSRLRDITTDANVDVTCLETFLDTEFTLIGQHHADAGLGWLVAADQVLPVHLDAMSLGDFEPDVWVPSSHPAAQREVISLGELARLDVVHGPRRAWPGIYDAWLASLRSADSRFEFTDPPFRRSLPLTLAFAASASRPTAVLTGPRHLAGGRTASEDRAADGSEMVCVRLTRPSLRRARRSRGAPTCHASFSRSSSTSQTASTCTRDAVAADGRPGKRGRGPARPLGRRPVGSMLAA